MNKEFDLNDTVLIDRQPINSDTSTILSGGSSGLSLGDSPGSLVNAKPSPDFDSFTYNVDSSRSNGSVVSRGERGEGSDRNTGASSSDGSTQQGTDALSSLRGHTVSDSIPIDIWQPNPDLSPGENIANLQLWLESLFNRYTALNPSDAYANFGSILSSVYTALSNSKNGNIRDLSDEATLELSEKVVDVMYSFINAQFNSALSYQSWYLQQEYNSPLNQINRLAAAGLHTSFALGSLNSGNAQSPAATPNIQQPALSNAGQAEASSHGNLFSFIGSIASTAVSVIPGVSSLISAACTAAMTPIQLANAKAELKNNGATFEKLKNEANLIEQNLQINSFNANLNAEQFGLNTAGTQLEQAKNLYQQDYDQYTQELEIEGWRTLVEDKQGHRKYIDMTNEEKEAFKNNGYTTSDGWSSVKDVSSSFGGSLEYGSEAHGSMFGFGGKSDSKYGLNGRVETGKSESQSGSAGTSSGTGESLKRSSQGYNENGTIERSGQTTFTSVTIRKRVPKEQFRSYLENSYNRYKKALDNYNFLSEGARSRLLNMVDNLQRNAAKYSSMNVFQNFRNQINDSFKNKEIDKTLIGD